MKMNKVWQEAYEKHIAELSPERKAELEATRKSIIEEYRADGFEVLDDEEVQTESKTWRVSCSNDMDDDFGYSAGPMVVYDGLTKAEAKSIARGKNREMFRLGLAGSVVYFAEDEVELADSWERSFLRCGPYHSPI